MAEAAPPSPPPHWNCTPSPLPQRQHQSSTTFIRSFFLPGLHCPLFVFYRAGTVVSGPAMRSVVFLVYLRLLCRTSLAVEDRPRRRPPPGWRRIEYQGNACYDRAYDDISVWANPYVLGEVVVQLLGHSQPATWSPFAHWNPPIHLLHRAENLVAGREGNATMRWANAAANASWESQGGHAGNSAIWHRPSRLFDRAGPPRRHDRTSGTISSWQFQ